MMVQSYGNNLREDFCIFAINIIIFAQSFIFSKIVMLERKILHETNTMCSHFIYTSPCQLHRHYEIQIILFTKGSGKQFVGDGMMEFHAGDVALIGSNVPHLHLCDTLSVNEDGTSPNVREAVQVSPDFFPSNMDNMPDYRDLSTLLSKAAYGIRFYDTELYTRLKDAFTLLDKLQGLERISLIFSIFGLLAKCQCTQTIALHVPNNVSGNPQSSINKTYSYLYEHFREEVKLDDIAQNAQMNTAALCRLFKKSTDMTIFQCLNDIRIEYACRLLSHTDLTVSQVGYGVGYNCITYFIQQFKKKLGITPGEYRNNISVR